MTTAPSSPDFTPRTAGLLAAARSSIRDGDTVFDLGAGRRAEIARALLADFPASRFIAVEPLVEVDAPEGVEVVAGEVTTLPPGSADVILFNPANTPERFLDPDNASYHQFYGGPTGTDIQHAVVRDAIPRLRPGGHLIFIVPTFTPLPDELWDAVELMWQGHEPRADFVLRVPVRSGLEAEYRDFLDQRIAALRPRWSRLGVQTQPDAITSAVLRYSGTGGGSGQGARTTAVGRRRPACADG
jgi:hypothetical protein